MTVTASGALAQDVEGIVDVHGSSTVAPISLAVSEDFAALNPGFGYTVGEEGTGDGFSQFFCVDNSDVSDASRPIREDEAALCAENGVEYTELKVAYDGLAVITSPQNPLECVTFADLYAVFGPESNGIATWQDAGAFAAELGSGTTFPEGDIAITAPSTESGTYDSFIELAPIGFVGLHYATEAGDAIKVLGVDGGEGCIVPDQPTVSDGTYPLSRPLFVYPALDRLASNPAITPWVDFYLSDEGLANVAEVGYVPLDAEEVEATRAAWAEAKGAAE
jgi:phosphate transport system substrate-binding protein